MQLILAILDKFMTSKLIFYSASILLQRFKAENMDIGIQIINVKNAPLGEARVRISIYDMQTGKVRKMRSSYCGCACITHIMNLPYEGPNLTQPEQQEFGGI